jgi:hypothetical protein
MNNNLLAADFSMRRYLISALCSLWLCGYSLSQDPCTSGPQSGQRCGPYAALIATGPQRGQSFCYICETGDKPAVLIFARTLTDSLGKLVTQLDKAVANHKKEDLRAWVTFLSDNQVEQDAKVVEWNKKYAIRSIPIGIFEDPLGPPGYRLTKDADITVLMFVKQKVVANFAFRASELNDDKIKLVMAGLPRIVPEKK